MKYFRVLLVMVKSLNFLFRNQDKDKQKLMKGNDREMGIFF